MALTEGNVEIDDEIFPLTERSVEIDDEIFPLTERNLEIDDEISPLPERNVEIDDEIFSLDVIPSATSALVSKAKDSLLGNLDLKALVTDLGNLGTFIRIAYNGVADDSNLQIKVQRVGYNIAKLADKSAVTVHSFKRTSNAVLLELQGTYEYLLDGLEEMALETLSGLANFAEKMSKASEELQKDFEAATEEVIHALEDTQTAKGSREEDKKKIKKEQEEMEMRMKQLEQIQKDAVKAEEMAEKLFSEAQKRENKAYKNQSRFLTKLTDAIEATFTASAALLQGDLEGVVKCLNNISVNNPHQEAMKNACKEKINALEDMQKQREMRQDANVKCIAFAEKIKNCSNDEDLAQVAIEALHNSVGALKSLSAVMMNAALFWQQMQKHCEALATDEMNKLIEKAMKFDKGKRLKVWTSTAFKRKAVTYYSRWVALDAVSEEYMLQIKETRADLYKYLTENPTIKESHENVRNLAIAFSDQLQKAHQDNEEKKKKTDEDMKKLQITKLETVEECTLKMTKIKP